MVYPNRVIFDGNEITYIPVDNEWVLANKPNTLLLSADKATIVADDLGSDVATITIQLQTPILADGTKDNLLDTICVSLAINGQEAEVSLVDGVGTLSIGAAMAKLFQVASVSHQSNIVEIEAT